jgi:hypothetical protein
MSKKTAFLAALAAVLSLEAAPARAFFYGSPGFPMKNGRNALEAIYDTGSTEIEPSDGGDEFDMKTNRLYFQYSRGLGNGLEFFGRVMPETGSVKFEDSNYEPDVWGLGGGVRWAPMQKGQFHFGLQFSFDWNQGSDNNTDIDIKELGFQGGGSYRVNKNVDAYGGLSLKKDDITLDPPAGGSIDFENTNTFGLFAGMDLKPTNNFTVAVELHLINETMFGVSGRFKF